MSYQRTLGTPGNGTFAALRSGGMWAQPFAEKVAKDQGDLSVLVISDSTAVINTPWTDQLWTLLASAWPEKTVKKATWADGTGWPAQATVHTGSGSRTVNAWNMSVPGKTTSYCQGAFWRTGVADIAPDLVLISHGHNQNSDDPAIIRSQFGMLVERVKATCPNAVIGLIAQNPEVANARQSIVAGEIAVVAGMTGAGFVNVHDLFLARSGWQSAWMEDPTTGVHPNAAGNAAWAAEILAQLTVDKSQQSRTLIPSSLTTLAANVGLTDPTFASFNGSTTPADWTNSGVTVAKDTAAGHYESPNGYAVQLTASSSGSLLYTDLPIKRYAGKTITFTAWIYKAAAQGQGVGRVAIGDSLGGSAVSPAESNGTDAVRPITVTHYIPSTSTYARLYLYATDGSTGSGVVSVDRVSVTEGGMPRGSAPGSAAAAAPGGTLLAVSQYAPGTAATIVTTSTTLAALDTTNLTVGPFTAPASGNVLVRLSAGWKATANGLWGVVLHGTATKVGATMSVYNSDALGTPITMATKVTGLTPGTSYQFDWAAVAASGFNAGLVAADPGNSFVQSAGPAVMEVLAA